MTYDVAIIGAGPAGLTAAIYACRAEKKTLVFEAKSFGGQIVQANDIENYPAMPHISGFELAKKMHTQATDLGAEFEFSKVIKISEDETGEKKLETEDSEVFFAKTIVIATGAKARQLGLKGESELIGRGVSYCATCDGAFYRDKVVAIQGGGNTAFEDATYLSSLAKKVYLLHRNENFRAERKLVEIAKKTANIEILTNSQVCALEVDDNGNLNNIKYTTKNPAETKSLAVSGLFVAIGQVPETANFSTLLELDDFGYFKSNSDCSTRLPGVFVAGDCRKKSIRQLVTATSDGAFAAIGAINFLNNS